MKIWAHTIVHNEEGFIWYAVMSVIDYVDKIIIYDTGSTDRTPHILKEIKKVYKKKVSIKTCGPVDKYQFSSLRQEMLDRSHCDWIIILDGDEVWWYDSVRRVEDLINREGTKLNAIAVPFYNVIGDIYHYQEEIAGRYKLLGREGNLQIKAINRKIPGLHIEQPYGSEGFYKATESFNYTADQPVIIRARYQGYIPFETTGTITNNGLTVTAVWLVDPNYTP